MLCSPVLRRHTSSIGPRSLRQGLLQHRQTPVTRPYNERRNRLVYVLVERRKLPQKIAAQRLGITHDNLRKILQRIRALSQYVTKKE